MSVAAEVFGLRRPELPVEPYEVIVCSEKRKVTLRNSVFAIQTSASLEDALSADTIVVPNRPDPLVRQRPAILELIQSADQQRKRLVSFCTGTFSLADAGVLNNRKVTTHWRWAEEFHARFPAIECVPNVLFVDEDQVLTAAGSASALDLCLHIVRKDFGAEVAHNVSRRLVFAMHRNGGQQQFINAPPVVVNDDRLSDLLDDLRLRLSNDHSVESMAADVAMAPSTFHRNFRKAAGVAPMTWLLRERVLLARRILETTDDTVDTVALKSGLGTSANLRLRFHREVGMTPSAYRSSHR